MYAKSIRPGAKRDDLIAGPRRAPTCMLRAKRAMRMCPRRGQIYFLYILMTWIRNFNLWVNLRLYDTKDNKIMSQLTNWMIA